MGRAPCCEKNGVKKGPWRPEEDQRLIDYIRLHGPGNWRNLPKNAGLQRCGKSCRLRWTNYLRPDIKRGRFSFEEEETIIRLHSILGNKWSAIAARLPGRTDNEIKNYWNTSIRKRLLKNGIDPVTHAPRLDLLAADPSSLLGALSNPNLLNLMTSQAPLLNPAELPRLISLLLSVKQGNINISDMLLQNHQLQQNLLQMMQPIQQIIHNAVPQDSQANLAQPKTDFGKVLPLNGDLTGGSPYGTCQPNSQQQTFSVPSWNASDGFVSQPSYLQPGSDILDSSLPPLLENFGFDSVRSTPISSPDALNSSSTFINNVSTTEEERESNCSSLFKFEIPESFNIEDFMS